jgi:two-component system, sporulation sensor kinase E
MKTAGFEDKLLARLDKLDTDQIQPILMRMLEQKQLLQNVFDYLDEGVIVTDLSMKLLFANRRARSMMGWTSNRPQAGEEIHTRLKKGHPLESIIESLRGQPRVIRNHEFEYGVRERRTVAFSTMLMRTDKAASPKKGAAEDSDGPVLRTDEHEDQTLIVILMRDVTERIRRQAEQSRAKRLSSMATMTSGIAHEIKNPLNSLKIHGHLLHEEIEKARQASRSLDEDKINRVARVLEEETERLADTVEEFLAAARPRSTNLEECTLKPLLEHIERVFSPECARYGIVMQISIDPEMPPIMMDEHLMMQALRNLVRNAIEALAEGADHENGEYEPVLGIRAVIAGDAVRIIVRDNGPGIEPDVIEHIMEAYFTTKFGGTGLGLMVVDRIITEHSGALHVHSEPGEGTEFIVSLPLHQKIIRHIEHRKEKLDGEDPDAPLNGSGTLEKG